MEDTFKDLMQDCPLIAILRGLTPAKAPAVGKVLWQAGFRILEVPLNSPQPLDSIAALRETLPDALIGAGTVLQASQVQDVQAAGGNLIISPNFNTAVLAQTRAAGLVSIPGVATPSEAFAALEAGAHALKLFPGEIITPQAVKAMRAVLPQDAVLIPVGGISLQNMAAYRAAGASGFGIGSALYRADKPLSTLERDAISFVAN
jgi:2-dehydro-3-deoxyphosphogalactonate aldolase